MAPELHSNDKAPDFALPNQRGEIVSLSKLRGKRVVLYFYPKDDTPGCTREACAFRDAMSSMQHADAVVLGVSLDGAASHQQFSEKYRLPFPLLSDEGGRVAKTYGAYKQKNLYGRKFWGIERSTFVIDGEGRVRAIFRKVKVDGHVDEVLAALKGKSTEGGSGRKVAARGRARTRSRR